MDKIKFSLFFLLFVLFWPYNASAQNSYNDLKILYTDANYSKCIRKGKRYTQRKKTQEDALPNLYVALAYYRIYVSGDAKLKSRHRDPFGNMLEYAGNFWLLDSTNSFKRENYEYIDRIKRETYSYTFDELVNKDSSETNSYAIDFLKKTLKFEEDSTTILILLASCNLRNKNLEEAAHCEARALSSSELLDTISAPYNRNLLWSVITLASIYIDYGDFDHALYFTNPFMKIFNENETYISLRKFLNEPEIEKPDFE